MEVHVNLRLYIGVMLTFRKINQTVERGGAEGIIESTWKISRASVLDELREQNLDLLWPRGASLYCETTDSTDRVVFLLQIIIEQDHKRTLYLNQFKFLLYSYNFRHFGLFNLLSLIFLAGSCQILILYTRSKNVFFLNNVLIISFKTNIVLNFSHRRTSQGQEQTMAASCRSCWLTE